MDINEVDALEYLAADDSTTAIAIHIETVKGDGRKFIQILRDTSLIKPVVVLKSGRTAAGAKAAASHTGSVARESDIVFDALLKQCGAVRAYTVEEFFDFAKAVGFLAPPKGNRIVIASLSGGEGVIAIDASQQHGFSMAKPGSNAYARAKAVFPPWEIPLNPFDLGVCSQFYGWSGLYDVFFGSMIGDAGVDCMAVGLPPFGMMFDPETACKPFLLSKSAGKTVAVWRPAPHESLDAFIEALESNGVPVYPSAERAIKALSVVYRYHNWRRTAG
jgi:acyl-CoA synthetase (NDP forming)